MLQQPAGRDDFNCCSSRPVAMHLNCAMRSVAAVACRPRCIQLLQQPAGCHAFYWLYSSPAAQRLNSSAARDGFITAIAAFLTIALISHPLQSTSPDTFNCAIPSIASDSFHYAAGRLQLLEKLGAPSPVSGVLARDVQIETEDVQ